MAKQGTLDDMRLLAIVGRSQIGRLTFSEPQQVTPRKLPRVGLHDILASKPTLTFGSGTCEVPRPELVMERIADAMTATLADLGNRIDERLLTDMRKEWESGIAVALTGATPPKRR